VFYEEVFRELDRRRVRYVVVGGVALVLHGVVRLTVDLDLMVHLERQNLTEFVNAMERLGYRPRVPVSATDFVEPENRTRWIAEKGMTVFSFFHPSEHGKVVDVFVDEPIPFRDVDAERTVREAGGVRIPLVSIRHLKQLKARAGRPQDLADIAALESLERMGDDS
jgi:hypothetical protein